MTSSRSSSDRVAEWRMRSICSLIERFLLDVGVGARDVGLGLVVVVVGDEILDRVLREERLELAVELGGERLVGGEDQRRALRRLDDLGHRVGLARAGDAEQHLVALLRVDARDQLGDRRRLVALRLELGDDAERHAALGLLRPRRTVRHPGLVAELRPAALDQRRQRLDRRGDRVGGDRRQPPATRHRTCGAASRLRPGFSVARNASASSSVMSMPGTGLRPAAARSRAVPLPPMEVPRAVLRAFCGASENPDLRGGIGRL